MNGLRILGQVLLWLGFLSAALAAVSQKEVDLLSEAERNSSPEAVEATLNRLENKWATVPWTWYGFSMAVGIVGVILLRSTAKTAQQEVGRIAAEFATVSETLHRLNSNVANLKNSLDTMHPKEVVHFIDEQCAEDFSDFADARNSLIQRFGLEAYAEIMTQFASAERFVNRAWSAAADGYVNEVSDCVARAEAHLKQANRLVNQYEGQSGSVKFGADQGGG